MFAAVDLSDVSCLVADDSVHMRRIVCAMLRGFGMRRIFEASDGADTLEQIDITAPDVLILDYVMPVLDGEEVLRLLRSPQSPNATLPVIVLSAHSLRRHVLAAQQAGAHHFLRKPLSAKSLYLHLVHVVMNPRPFERTATYFGPVRPEPEEPPARKRFGVEVETGAEVALAR